jgi:diguanylate cyclase (GGDEF)-like protein
MGATTLTDPARLAAVRGLAILDTAAEPEFDDLAQIAAAICRTPAALVAFVDEIRQFVKAAAGAPELTGRSISVDISLCAAVIRSEAGLVVVPDVRADPMWRDNPVIAARRIASCVGVAIHHRGQPVGAICALGDSPHLPPPEELAALRALARQAGGHLELRRRNEEWRNIAGTDPLTGLANRRLLGESMELALSERRMGEDQVGVLFCDIDGFKAVNDRLGHEAGDRLLCEVARRLRGAVRETDVVARIAGDEFIVLCPRLGGADALELTADRVRVACHELRLDRAVTVRLSVGAALAAEAESAESLLRRADAAMYAEKAVRRVPAPGAGGV